MKSDTPAHRLLPSNLRSQWRRPSDYTPSTVQHRDTGRPCKKTLSTSMTFQSQSITIALTVAVHNTASTALPGER